MNERIADFIIAFLWAFFLFDLWFIWSLFKSTEGQWWSFLILNMENPSGLALEISFFKIFIAFSLSLLIASFLASWWRRKRKHNSS
ncbi:hypothetical protein [Niallia oryzisoli]|uniref:hypothetical protein n=1 Tax=Niallia oryzisoli TaxID=1737571 RepID=UPI0037370CBD